MKYPELLDRFEALLEEQGVEPPVEQRTDMWVVPLMVIPLDGPSQDCPEVQPCFADEENQRVIAQGAFYTCKNLLTNGDCGIYETRPKMCREYPHYGRAGALCRYSTCTWSRYRADLPVPLPAALPTACPHPVDS